MAATIQTDAIFRNERRAALSAHPDQIGIDYIEVAPDPAVPLQWLLRLHFVPASIPGKSAIPRQPEQIPRANVRITSGTGALATTMQVIASPVAGPGADVLTITVRFDPGAAQEASAFATYTLELAGVDNLDPFFAQVSFSLRANTPGDLDPQAMPAPPTMPVDEPVIDYLARDYASFRQLMLNRLELLMPQWQERHPADLGVALVEVLAYAADQLSYYQDAVATEAYLGTARRRISVRRHARLVDYAMHEGCNARVWVQVQVNDDGVSLPSGTPLLTRCGAAAILAPDAYDQALAAGAQVFETMHPATLYRAHNELHFYTWGAHACVLPQGATQATLRAAGLALQRGDVLIFEQVKEPGTDSATDADPAYRHAVRLTRVTPGKDPLGGQLLNPESPGEVPVVEIEWEPADALPFPLQLAAYREDVASTNMSVARGNIVLADHGRTVATEELPAVPKTGRYQPQLQYGNLTYSVPYNDARARSQPATLAMVQDPREAVPAVTLYESGEGRTPQALPLYPSETQLLHTGTSWLPRRDFLASDRFAREFVVEMENDGRATLRFGDGVRGRRLTGDIRLHARYRVGNGPLGNVGHEAISHVVIADARIIGVRNPLAAQGGSAPESLEQVRLAAPAAFHIQERCVTAEDYASAARRHPEVLQAAAVLRWTGNWYTAFVAVTRRGGQPVDERFRDALLAFLERLRLAGYDLEICAPRYVPLDIALPITVAPDAFRTTVRQALRETFSAVELAGGRRGFFHPDNFGFGQPVYLSQIVTAAMRVPGVVRVDIAASGQPLRFQRWGRPARGELRAGQIAVDPLEIARLDNAAAAPQNGTLAFFLEGGR